LKAISFIINSNILIALAAVSLTLASQVQLGQLPQMKVYLLVIFLATLLDYSFHRFLAVKNNTGTVVAEKLQWSADHLALVKTLIFTSCIGLLVSLFFVTPLVLAFLVPLAAISMLYSFSVSGKPKNSKSILRITGVKTLLIAFVWTTATVLLPALEGGFSTDYSGLILLFAGRFAFIFAIAIPFDIRDMESDKQASLRTIPITFGESYAIKISNSALLLSLSVSTVHYMYADRLFLLPANFLSVVITALIINKKSLKSLPYYYHGFLDGSILLSGILILLNYYIFNHT
jgi:4-hydroxybenzoate polyprenyltransferase